MSHAVGSTASTATYFHTEHLGSTRVCTNSSGDSVGTCYYEPFGEIQPGTSCGVSVNYRFAGMEFDSETGLYHTWFRQYDPSQGRWMSVDPLPGSSDSPQSLDRYLYVLDDPTNLVDPLGLKCQTDPDGVTRCEVIAKDPGGGFTDVFPCTLVYINGFYVGNTCHSNGESVRDIRGTARGGRDGTAPPQEQTVMQVVNCAAKNSSNFTIAFVLGKEKNPIVNTFLGSSPISPLIVLATEPNSQNAVDAGVAMAQEAASRGTRPATAVVANTRAGPNLQTLNTQVTGPRFGSTPVGGGIVRTVGKVTKALAKVPTLPWEASVFAFSFFMCGE